ncbi:MAG: response regulator [Selenomonadaceae bacterium]|nr:response regulator [Selenomonadaceae bacterium]
MENDNIVLVVDDDEMNLHVAKMILEKKLPCRVITADSGEKCLEILKSQNVRVILLDVMMPEMDGIETLQEIRYHEKLEDIPVIMLTASLDKDNIKKAAALGVKDYVRKPFMPNELIERVSKKLVQPKIEKVLVIAEENNLQDWQQVLTKNFPHEFIFKTTGAAGVEVLREEEIILVILSGELKFIDGFQVLVFMSKTEKFNSVPLLVSNSKEISAILEKLKPVAQDSPKKDTPVKESPKKNHVDKKFANVVTNLIGYKLRA